MHDEVMECPKCHAGAQASGGSDDGTHYLCLACGCRFVFDVKTLEVTIEKDDMPVEACAHPALRFGSGGYYVFCSAPGCNAAWIAWKMGEDERVPGVTKGQPICGSTTMGDRIEMPIASLTKSEKGEAAQESIAITVVCPTCQRKHMQETVSGDQTRYSYCPECREIRRTKPPGWMSSGRHG